MFDLSYLNGINTWVKVKMTYLLVSVTSENASVIGAAVGGFVGGALVVFVGVFVWFGIRRRLPKQMTDTGLEYYV